MCINFVKETCFFSQKYQKWICLILELNSSIVSTKSSVKASWILKVLGKSVGLCKTATRKDQLYISFLVYVWRIICENFNPNRLICGASSRKPYNVGEFFSSFRQIWILQILSFKSIYNLPYFIVRKIEKYDRNLEESCMAQFSFPSVFLAFMISDFIRVTW